MRIILVISMAGILLLGACGPERKSPEALAGAFFNALESQNFKKAGKYCTEQSRLTINELQDDIEAFDFPYPDTFYVFQIPIAKGADTMIMEYAIDSATFAHPYQLLVAKRHTPWWQVSYQRTDPVGIARYFLDAFHKGDFEKAEAYLDENSIEDLKFLQSIYEGWQGPGVRITGIGFNDDKNRAIVMFLEGAKSEEQKLNLVRIEGHWKVALSKSSAF